MNRRTLALVIAGCLALGAGLLTFDYLQGVSRRNASAAPPRAVLVAAQDITAREKLTPAMVRVVARPADAVDPNALSSPGAISGEIALITIPAGATLTANNTGQPQQVALPVRLRPGMRAVSIPVDVVKDVSGLVEPGDRVDVIAVPPRGPSRTPRAYTILRDIEVVAVGAGLEEPSATPGPADADPRTVTLEVTPPQANLLTMADLNTTLRLALRSPQERAGSYPTQTLVFSDQFQSQPAAPRADPRVASAPVLREDPAPRNPSPVMVIDGDQITNSGRTSNQR